MTFVKQIGCAATAMLVGASVSAPRAQAAYTVTLAEQGSNVVATGSGTLDLAGRTMTEGATTRLRSTRYEEYPSQEISPVAVSLPAQEPASAPIRSGMINDTGEISGAVGSVPVAEIASPINSMKSTMPQRNPWAKRRLIRPAA